MPTMRAVACPPHTLNSFKCHLERVGWQPHTPSIPRQYTRWGHSTLSTSIATTCNRITREHTLTHRVSRNKWWAILLKRVVTTIGRTALIRTRREAFTVNQPKIWAIYNTISIPGSLRATLKTNRLKGLTEDSLLLRLDLLDKGSSYPEVPNPPLPQRNFQSYNH